MVKKFMKDFVKKSKQIYESGEKSVWLIPKGANKYKGDYGLLPEDTDIRSWQIPPSSAMLLRFLMLSKKAKIALELGASVGYSTIWLGLAAKEIGGHVYTTEIFKAKAKIAKKNFTKANVADYITLYEKKIINVLKEWPKDKKIDFVFMDADKQNYGKYLKLMYPLLNKGAMIVVDNVGDYPEHMEEFLEQCKTIKDAATYMLEIDHGIFLFVKGGGKNLMPLLTENFPLFKSNTLKVLIKDEELLGFWKNYMDSKVNLRSDVLISPLILDILDNVKGKKILMMEWGPGKLSKKLTKKGAFVTKIDLKEQINSFKNLKRPSDIKYISSEIFNKQNNPLNEKYDIIVSYMFHLYLNREEFFKSFKFIKQNLKDNGSLIYSDIQPFRAIVKNKIQRGVISLHNPFHANYLQFIHLQAKLRASNGDSLLSEYNRYPMSFLMNIFSKEGLKINNYYEPIPNVKDFKTYPILFSEEDKRVPPYILLKLIK